MLDLLGAYVLIMSIRVRGGLTACFVFASPALTTFAQHGGLYSCRCIIQGALNAARSKFAFMLENPSWLIPSTNYKTASDLRIADTQQPCLPQLLVSSTLKDAAHTLDDEESRYATVKHDFVFHLIHNIAGEGRVADNTWMISNINSTIEDLRRPFKYL